MGITFTVYSDGRDIDRAWPFDVIPRVIEAGEWARIARGLEQRLVALNRFIDDVYNDQRVIADGVFPRELLDDSANFRPECKGVRPRFGVWAHVSGSDLVRDADGTMYVLEDNLRVPSGVSYVLENRAICKRAFPEVFARQRISPVDSYTEELSKMLVSIAPDDVANPSVVVLTPGIFNSAYFEHSFLAQRMGAALVEGSDLVVSDDDRVFMRTIDGLEPVDVIYRRIDDQFLDPEAFRPDSLLGVPGLMRAWKSGRVAIANAPGAGVADDKVVYAWVPDLIRYYLGEEPLIPNVPTHRCLYADERRFVLDNVRDLVLKPANESGGYGIVIGDRATDAQLDAVAAAIAEDPRNWVAQPIVQLSTAPDALRRRRRAAPRRSPSVHSHRVEQLRDSRRTDARRSRQGLADRQLLSGWGQQGHVDRRGRRRRPRRSGSARDELTCCCRELPTTSIGRPAISSVPRTPPASCVPTPRRSSTSQDDPTPTGSR